MQPTSSTAAAPQSDIHKTMQSQPQQIIMSTNKKKKYVHQPPSPQQQNQHQYQLTKSYNPMKTCVKASVNQQQTQNYVNVGNRSLQGMSSGNVALNSCQLTAANASTLFALNQLGVVRGGISTHTIDANHLNSSVYGNNSVGSTSCTNSTSCNIGGTSTSSHANGVELIMGTSKGSNNSYINENGIVGINASGVHVSGCNDSRKYELQIKNNNKLLSNNNSFPTATEFISSSGSNGTSNARQTQQTNTMYRGPPSSGAPPRGARHVSMQPMFQQPMHQGVVLPTYSAYAPRQPTYQSAQYPYSQTLQPFYSSYQFYQPIQQPPTHQRGPVGVSPGVGVGNAISVQPSPNGPPGAPQTQLSIAPGTVLSVPPCPSTVLSVSSSAPGQQQIGVGMPSIVGVGVPVPGAVSSSTGQNKVRRRKHALDIIDPDTKRNIFEDIEATCSNPNEPNNQEQLISTPLIVGEMQTVSPQAVVLTADSRPVIYNMDVHQMQQQQQQQRDIACGQTPIVSAMSDAPSVEIRPTLQKPRSKRIPITSPKDEPSKVTSSENIEDESSKHMTHTNTSSDTSADLPQLPQLSQVPLECQNQPNQYSQLSIKSPQFETQDVAFIANENKTNKKKHISKESRFAAHDQQTDSENNRPNMESEQRSEVDYCRNSCASSVAFDGDKVSSETDVGKNEVEDSVGAVEESKNSVETMNIVEQDKVELCTSDLTQNENVLVSFNNVDEYKNNTAKEPLISDENVNLADEVVADGKQLNNIEYAAVASCDMSIYDETDRSSIEPKNLVSEKNNTEEISLKSPTHSESSSITRASSIESKINLLANPFKTPQTTVSAPTIVPVAQQSLIQYNEGQWSPQNPTGKKRYNREQLLKLREAKASRIQPDVKNASILPQPNLMPSFARGNNSKRVQSMVGSIGGNRCGPDGGSYISKQASMSGVNSRGSTKGMIHVNLSLNQDVKLSETDNAWRPRALVSGKEVDGDSANQPQREKEDLIRSVRGILNKLTPEKFDKLVEEILKLRIDTPDKLEAVMILVFEKAIDEPIFSVSYARLCNRLIGEVRGIKRNTSVETAENLAHFRSALLDKTEREFTQNVSNCAAKEAKLQPILDKIKNCTDPIEKIELQAQLEEEERKIRRRSGGTVRFIGELFKISLLTGNIINHCINTLLEPKTEDMLECLCKLLTTVGAKFEQTQIPKDENNKEVRYYSLNRVVARMQTIASKNDNVKVSSRVRFMLLDVIDLRKNKWQSSKNEAPKTMEQIEKEAKNEQLSSQYFNYSGMLQGSGGGGSSGGANSSSCKRDDRLNNRYDSRSSLGYGSSHNQRSDNSSLRRQQQGGAGGSSGGNSGGNNSGSSNFGGDDNAWQVQTGKGRSLAVDSNKLEGLNFTQSLDMGSKKMGGVSQFIWNQQRQSAPTLAPANSFAVLSTLVDSNKNSSDRGGTRNKGSVERDRYNNDRGIHSRTGSSQGSRENSSSRIQQGGRAMINASTVQKSASHKNYTQLMSPRNSVKSTGASSTSANALHPHHQHEQPHQISQSQQVSGVEFTNKSLFPSAPPMAVFDIPSATEQQLMKSVTLEFIEATANVKIVTAAVVPIINRLPDNQRCGYLYYILTDYLHLANVNQLHRRYLANIVIYMIKHKFIALEHFHLAYEQLCEISSDLIYDVPELWLYVFEFVAPLLQKQILSIHDLWIEKLQESDTEKLGQKFLKSFLVCCTREIGPNFTKGLWIKFNMAWTDFMPKSEVQNFIQCNKFEYIENESAPLEILVKENVKHVVERVELLLLEGSDHNAIIDYINGNIANVDKKFVSSLTTVITNFAIQLKDGTYKLDTVRFQKVCLPVLHRYIDVNAERELECLYAMQFIVNSLEHPRGLLPELFAGLYDHDVITIESFLNWRDSKDQPAGKGVAVKGLGPFFNGLLSGETSEENN